MIYIIITCNLALMGAAYYFGRHHANTKWENKIMDLYLEARDTGLISSSIGHFYSALMNEITTEDMLKGLQSRMDSIKEAEESRIRELALARETDTR